VKSRTVNDLNSLASILIVSFSASIIASSIDSFISVCVLMLCVEILVVVMFVMLLLIEDVVMLVDAVVILFAWCCRLNAWRSLR